MLSLLKRIKCKLLRSFKGPENMLLKDQNVFFNKHGWEVEDITENHLLLSNNDKKVKIRREGSTDYEVFKQIFIHQEYYSVLTLFKNNEVELENVIDAGANIGLTSVFIKSIFPHAKIACIEPDNENFKVLKEDMKSIIVDHSIQLFKAGLMGISNLNLSIGSDFRGGGDWAKQIVLSDEDSELKSITIKDVCEKMNFKSIDLLKIDIEGAENFLIEENTDLTFLTLTKVIAIEIHDEYNCRSQINALLRQYHFLLLEVGETTIAINKKMI